MISSYQFFYVLIGKEGVARKLILLFQLSWINQESVICGSQHFFHPAEEDLPKSVLPGAPILMPKVAVLRHCGSDKPEYGT